MDLRKRLYFFLPALVVALLHNLVHEGIHYLAANLLGEEVLEFRFLTNGWGTSQVIFATPVDERAGAHWLVIAWAPSVVTVAIGYLVYLNRERWWTRWRWINAGIWYAALFFLCLDPFYLGLLSLLMGSDLDAVAAVGWSPWPTRLLVLTVLAVNAWLLVRWSRQARKRARTAERPGLAEG